MTYNDFILFAENRVWENDGTERVGQAYMNALREIRPDLYRLVTELGRYINADPFYDDRNIIAFYELIKENWN